MARLTFPKISAGAYGVSVDGRDTGLRIERADYDRKKWGASQTWDVIDAAEPDSYIFAGKGLDHAKACLRLLADRLTMGAI